MNIKELLDFQVERHNRPEFADNDPVQFPRRFKELRDVEIVAFLVSNIAWGKRSMILRNAERMLKQIGACPFDYVMSEGYEQLGKANVHRTFFEHNMSYMLRGFRRFYSLYDSMDAYMASATEKTPQRLVETLRCVAAEANDNKYDIRCYSNDLRNSALKRVNLALRWLVRNDGIVDLGVWKSMKPSELFIPLDVHAGNTARTLGLLERRTNDWKAVAELTARLREFNAADPVIYDFALFGIGVNGGDL